MTHNSNSRLWMKLIRHMCFRFVFCWYFLEITTYFIVRLVVFSFVIILCHANEFNNLLISFIMFGDG